MVVESGSRAKEAAAPSGSRQQGEAQETERTATQGEPTPSIAGANDDMSRQEQSPLSTPEDVGELGVSDRDREWCRPGEKIGAEGRASGNASPHCPRGAAPDAKDTDKAATPLATATVHRENNEVPPKEKADATEGLPHDRMSAVELKGRGGLSWGGAEETAGSEQPTKARDQAKRLALEVARLRSSLRATTSELNTERSTRVRVEDEWWKKIGEWEEERGSLVASMQEAERRSRSAEQEVQRVLAESKAREANAASERVAREAAQHKADSVMEHVLNVQDRLVQALQAELTMTNRAREAAQDDARETKKQLRLYVQDFLLWRDRAKRLEDRQADNEAPTSLPLSGGNDTGPATTEASPSPREGSVEDFGRTQTGKNGEPPDESIAEKYARYFESDTGGCPVAPTDTALFGLQETEDPKEGRGVTETDTAAAAWSTRLAMAGSSSAAAQAHFQRSMKAQQAASARLENDLMKARADLQSIYAGSRTAGLGGGGRGRATGAGLRPGTEEEVLGIALSEAEHDRGDGDGGEGSNDNQCSPESPTGEEKRDCCASAKEKAGESVATHAIEGSHLARVLAVLLGGDPAGRVSDDPPTLPLRLADFPPTLQAVFGGGPAVASPATFEHHRVTSSKGAHGRRRGTRLSQQKKRRWARESPVQIDGRSEIDLAGKAASSENGRVLSAATGHAGADGYGRTEGRQEEMLHSAWGASTEPGAAEGRDRSSFTGELHGYKAKSSLLQRWLDERESPPLPQPDA